MIIVNVNKLDASIEWTKMGLGWMSYATSASCPEENSRVNQLLDGLISLLAHISSYDDRFEHQNCYGFPLTSSWRGIVHHLSGPSVYALGATFLAMRTKRFGSAERLKKRSSFFETWAHAGLLGPCFKTAPGSTESYIVAERRFQLLLFSVLFDYYIWQFTTFALFIHQPNFRNYVVVKDWIPSFNSYQVHYNDVFRINNYNLWMVVTSTILKYFSIAFKCWSSASINDWENYLIVWSTMI